MVHTKNLIYHVIFKSELYAERGKGTLGYTKERVPGYSYILIIKKLIVQNDVQQQAVCASGK